MCGCGYDLFFVLLIVVVVFDFFVEFFFFKQKTAYERRISDWSADVCSSDLERRYLGALHALMRDVENEVADRYIVLHPGDWVTLPDGPIGCLVSRQGLEGCFLAPSLDPSPAMESPERAMTRWSLDDPAIAPAKPECRPPADALCYYWLLAANRRWQTACRLTEDDEVTLPYLRDRLTDILDAASKAWLSVTDPGSDRVAWAQICAGQHVPLLEAGAPSSVALPLTEADRTSTRLNYSH